MTTSEAKAFRRVVTLLDRMSFAAESTALNHFASLDDYAREQPEGCRMIRESRAAVSEGLSLIEGRT